MSNQGNTASITNRTNRYDRSKGLIVPTGIARPWDTEEIIVSKTDTRGILTYANDVFQRVSLMSSKDLIGKPHNVIRPPYMPRCIFKLLWDNISSKKEVFAYVLNIASNGDHYWVFAHVTPSYDSSMNIIGYHSNRRKPDDEKITKIKPLYEILLEEELKHNSPREGLQASEKLLQETLKKSDMEYDEFIFSF